ncbi:patatin-like phospholipase family protein [Pseudochelatococcus sp. B33]
MEQHRAGDDPPEHRPGPDGQRAETDETPAGGMRFGLALGGGAARGWAHIGVLKVLRREGLQPSVIAGTSIGAVVGGCYAAGKLDELEDFARSLTKRRVVGLMDFHINGSGLLAGDRLQKLLVENLGALKIEELPLRFAAVATELGSGHEIWLTRGQLAEALRASYALPGVFDAVRLGGRWLMDGALVNPIPVTATRVLGAEAAVAVNLNGDPRARTAMGPTLDPEEAQELIDSAEHPTDSLLRRFFAPFQSALPGARGQQRRPRAPGLATVLMDAFNITQDRIARSRLAGDPPDITIAPRLAHVGLFDFHRAGEIIALGEKATERALPDLLEYLRGEDGAEPR